MSVADIRLRYRELVIPDLYTVHSKILDQAIKDVHELLVEVKRLRGFAAYVMADVWEHNEPDCGSIQDKAEELGLIELRPLDSEDSIYGESEHYFISWAKPRRDS